MISPPSAVTRQILRPARIQGVHDSPSLTKGERLEEISISLIPSRYIYIYIFFSFFTIYIYTRLVGGNEEDRSRSPRSVKSGWAKAGASLGSRHPLHSSNSARTRWPEYIPLIILCVHSECELSINHRRREGWVWVGR